MLRGIRLGSLRVPGAAANEHQESRDISRDPSRRAPSRSRPPTTLKPAWEAPAALGRFDPFRRSATQQRGVLPRSVTGGAGEGKEQSKGYEIPETRLGLLRACFWHHTQPWPGRHFTSLPPTRVFPGLRRFPTSCLQPQSSVAHHRAPGPDLQAPLAAQYDWTGCSLKSPLEREYQLQRTGLRGGSKLQPMAEAATTHYELEDVDAKSQAPLHSSRRPGAYACYACLPTLSMVLLRRPNA